MRTTDTNRRKHSYFDVVLANKYQPHQSPYSLHCGLAATEANEVPINKTRIDKHVKLDFKTGNYNDSYCFRVFPSLQADVILGLDWLAYHNPTGPNWKTGVMCLHEDVLKVCEMF